MSYIEVNSLKKYFNDNLVLDIERFEANKGELIAIIGKNGSGKSTFIKLLSGILVQSEGEIKISDNINDDKFFRENSKFVLESGKGYYDYLTARENIRYFLSLNKINYKSKIKELELYSKQLEFDKHLDKKVSELSQGNRQKLSIIVALLTDTNIIYLDEPTNGLDIVSNNLLLKFIYNLHTQKEKTIFITSHDVSFLKNIDMRIILIKDGKIIKDTNSFELLYNVNLEKDVIELKLEDEYLLSDLKHSKYKFLNDKIKISVYDENETAKILKKTVPISLKKEILDVDDIFFTVVGSHEWIFRRMQTKSKWNVEIQI